jgi:hypothetical protein
MAGRSTELKSIQPTDGLLYDPAAVWLIFCSGLATDQQLSEPMQTHLPLKLVWIAVEDLAGT